MSKPVPEWEIRRGRRTRLVKMVLLAALVVFGSSSALYSVGTSGGAKADEVSDLMSEPSNQSQAPQAVATVANCDSERAAYEASLPVPSPTPGTNGNIGYVVQLVNESNVTLLAAANQAGQGGQPHVPVLPREGSWVMQPFGTTLAWPDGTPQNTLTIDIPPEWENTICGTSSNPVAGCVGPLFWARTGCRFDAAHDHAQCETGTCSSHYDCSKAAQSPTGPKTFTEWTFRDNNTPPLSAPDISVVDGASINVDIEPIGPGFPNATLPGFNTATWMSPQNLPLTLCGQDLRAICPAGQFQLLRNQQGMFIQGSSGGNDVVGCFSNCGLYVFQGGTSTGSGAPCPGFRCPGAPPMDCDVTTDPICNYWKSFCCVAAAGDPMNIYTSLCTTPNQVPSPQCQQNGICWAERGTCPPGAMNCVPNGKCSCSAFIKGPNCAPSVCTNPPPQAQPPFNLCSTVSPDSSVCIGDDTVHSIMPRGLTWPNDPETYFSNARAFRIVFAPGAFVAGAQVPPITDSGPIPVCSSLPSGYGYTTQYGGQNSTKGLPCDDSVNKNGAQFAGALFGADATTPGKQWACDIADGIPPANNQVLCRWSAEAPTPTPTPSGSPTSTGTGVPTATPTGAKTPTATPTPQANTVFSGPHVNLEGGPGAQVTTEFAATNNTSATEAISSVTLALSNPKILSALTLSANGQSGTGNPSPPTGSNSFTFSPALSLPSGATLDFTVTGTISGSSAKNSPSILSPRVAYAADTQNTNPASESTTVPWLALMMMVSIATLVSKLRSRRWMLVAGALLVVVAFAGCGGSSGGPAVSGSVSGMSVTDATTKGPTTGLPLSIATVKKQ